MMTKRNIWYIQYWKSHDLHGIIPCKSMYATLHFDKRNYLQVWIFLIVGPYALGTQAPNKRASESPATQLR
ncbi:hypothetical protein ACN38_g6286 [Penicillium nordicum]|uniref:Uncharacterized protein n=1 Tax=Penicillium nordicum TaxID=229535 RepID=A0A0M9WFF4_9EURO|nr:hypothetical protein ACN38_g6286 [Penicillium nordicum]